MIQSKQQPFFVVPLHPGPPMINRNTFRQPICLGEIYEPHPHLAVIINHKHAAADDLVRSKILRLLDLRPDVAQTFQQALADIFTGADEQLQRVDDLVARLDAFEVRDGGEPRHFIASILKPWLQVEDCCSRNCM